MSNVSDTLAARAKTYGDFRDIARISQSLQNTLRSGPKWEGMSLSGREALQAICSKMARIVNGDPEYLDNWHDIGGYSGLEENRLITQAAKIDAACEKALQAPVLATPPDGFDVEFVGPGAIFPAPWRARGLTGLWLYAATRDAALDAAQKG